VRQVAHPCALGPGGSSAARRPSDATAASTAGVCSTPAGRLPRALPLRACGGAALYLRPPEDKKMSGWAGLFVYSFTIHTDATVLHCFRSNLIFFFFFSFSFYYLDFKSMIQTKKIYKQIK
jgi:hypothetical protein